MYFIPPWAKQTLSFGNFSKTPPKIIEQIAMDVSEVIPESEEIRSEYEFLFADKEIILIT